jgi:lysophospholipase L1-like esterase|tara:strand:- start:2019 stop:2837 length:819 start_codon:yes stop_codon:yes gene_type:complete
MKKKKMSTKLKYFLGLLISIPLLPFLYFQGKSIRKKTPVLPEAAVPIGFVDGQFKSTLSLLTIGESTIAGVGVKEHKEGFTGALAQTLSKVFQQNIKWRVYARSGYTAKQLCTKIVPKIEETTVDLIVIGIGGNDSFTLNSLKKWSSDVENLIHLLQHKFPKTPLFFTNMPPIKEFPAFTGLMKFVIGNLVEILGEHLHILANKEPNVYYNREVIRLKEWSIRNNLPIHTAGIYFSDGVHPSELTYKVWGKEMGSFIFSQNIQPTKPPVSLF